MRVWVYCLLPWVSHGFVESSRKTLDTTHAKAGVLRPTFALQNSSNESPVNQAQTSDHAETEYKVRLHHEGRSFTVFVREDETILSAMERNRLTMALSELPSDCRRGNCLTCVGKHTKDSNQNASISIGNGLAPSTSRRIDNNGYVLTCSSKVVEAGLELELNANQLVWEDVYFKRLAEDSTRQIAQAAMAKSIRLTDEKNVPRWTRETEETLQKTDDMELS